MLRSCVNTMVLKISSISVMSWWNFDNAKSKSSTCETVGTMAVSARSVDDVTVWCHSAGRRHRTYCSILFNLYGILVCDIKNEMILLYAGLRTVWLIKKKNCIKSPTGPPGANFLCWTGGNLSYGTLVTLWPTKIFVDFRACDLWWPYKLNKMQQYGEYLDNLNTSCGLGNG
jgi:hypothetical protein